MTNSPTPTVFFSFRASRVSAWAIALIALLFVGEALGQTMSKLLIESRTEIIPANSNDVAVFGGDSADSGAAITSGEDYRVIHATAADTAGSGFLSREVHNDLDGTGPEDVGVVDWVLVQIRIVDKPVDPLSAAPPEDAAKRIVSKAGLLLSNGIIVDADNPTEEVLSFEDVDFDDATEDLYVAVKHRNHVPILSEDPVADDGDGGGAVDDGVYDYDFAVPTNVQGQPNSIAVRRDGTAAMLGGDFNSNGDVGVLDDVNSLARPTFDMNGYLPGDGNLDGDVGVLADVNSLARNNYDRGIQFTF